MQAIHHSATVDRDKLITFLLIDALNDDLRGLYELWDTVQLYFEKIGLGALHPHELSTAALQLCHKNLIRLELVLNPGLTTLRELDHDSERSILVDRSNWIDRTSNQIYAATIVDANKTIALERRLWVELGNKG